MISRLFRVELRRLWYRRAAKVLAIGLIGITLISFGVAFRNSRKVSDAEFEQLRRDAVAEATRGFGGDVPPGVELSPDNVFVDDPRFVLEDDLPDFLLGVGGLVAVGAFVFGATAGGADWSAGTVQALLFWEPRRVRVILTKAAALAAVVFAFALAVQLLSYGLGGLTASARGTLDGADAEFWRFLVGRSLRLGAITGFASLVAFGIAGFTRNTGAALGAAFAYFVILENLLRALRPRWQPYLLSENMDAFIRNGVNLFFQDDGRPYFNSGTRAGAVLATYLVVILGTLTVSFARRDVT